MFNRNTNQCTNHFIYCKYFMLCSATPFHPSSMLFQAQTFTYIIFNRVSFLRSILCCWIFNWMDRKKSVHKISEIVFHTQEHPSMPNIKYMYGQWISIQIIVIKYWLFVTHMYIHTYIYNNDGDMVRKVKMNICRHTAYGQTLNRKRHIVFMKDTFQNNQITHIFDFKCECICLDRGGERKILCSWKWATFQKKNMVYNTFEVLSSQTFEEVLSNRNYQVRLAERSKAPPRRTSPLTLFFDFENVLVFYSLLANIYFFVTVWEIN